MHMWHATLESWLWRDREDIYMCGHFLMLLQFLACESTYLCHYSLMLWHYFACSSTGVCCICVSLIVWQCLRWALHVYLSHLRCIAAITKPFFCLLNVTTIESKKMLLVIVIRTLWLEEDVRIRWLSESRLRCVIDLMWEKTWRGWDMIKICV